MNAFDDSNTTQNLNSPDDNIDIISVSPWAPWQWLVCGPHC